MIIIENALKFLQKKIHIGLLILGLILIFFMFNKQYIYNKTVENLPEQSTLNKVVLELWKEVLTVSDEQNLVPPEVIIKTIKFMIQEANEDDPELIAFVKSLIQPPSSKPINLSDKNRKDFSQIGQSAFIDKALNQRRNGFFVESGGYNGESFSNSLFFELERNWSGILIEAIPSYYQTILSKNRKISVINACIAGKRPFIAKFRVAGAISGRLSEMNDRHLQRVEQDTNKVKVWVYVPCFPLSTILKAMNVKKVDYFSLDIEGGEWNVIQNINFNEIDIETFTIEWPASPSTKGLIQDRLIAHKYQLMHDDGSDLYLKKVY